MLTATLAVLVLAQCSLGLLMPEVYVDPAWIKAAWFSNDLVTLVVALPFLIVTSKLARQGSPRGFLVWVGVLGYCAYNYAYYLLGVALNAFFSIYVIALGVSAVALILALSRANVAELAASFRNRAPMRIVSGYLIFVGAGLACAWLATWAAHFFTGKPTPVAPEAFKLVAALDLSLMVPMLVTGGILLWRKQAWGYVIATIASVQGALYLAVLSTSSLVAIQRTLVKAPGEVPMWRALALLMGASAVVLVRDVRPVQE